MSTLDILGNTSEQADSIRLMLKVRGMKDGRFIDADPLIILKATIIKVPTGGTCMSARRCIRPPNRMARSPAC